MLQFVYLGNTGFRFPVVHYPTREVDPSTLYIKFWEIVGWLEMAGFSVIYTCCDGGQANRSFIQLQFKGRDVVKEKYTTTNIHTGQPMVFFLDLSVSSLTKQLILFRVHPFTCFLHSAQKKPSDAYIHISIVKESFFLDKVSFQI